MFAFLLITAFFYTAPVQFQHKYDYCKSVDFEAKNDYCKLQKKLSSFEQKEKN